ncbi:zinc finger protein [Abeliophyllum distichum]|uniref:Zinc finger protein n=1 Tax=Abeliophyllum distichum TaxID=126358 RepID=A0ABD1UMV2_9LAMI
MDDINVLIYYDGRWDNYCYYKDYSVVGIVIPIDCSYVVLVDLIMKELKRDSAHYDVTIQYQVVANGPLIRILGDSSVSFYKGIKKNESDLTKFQLCVDINLIPYIYDNRMTLDTVMTT